MVFDDHKLVFFHIGKTAGYSIEQSILPSSRDYRVYDNDLVYGLRDGVMTQHARPSYVLKLRPDISEYFWFTFVRNPWDRMVSAYCYLKPHNDTMHGSFKNWLKSIEKGNRSGKGFPEGSHYHSQSSYFLDDRPMNFTGRFENISDDWNALCKLLGIESELKNQNKSKFREKKHYSEFYDKESVGIVADLYKEDIERFAYEFETN